MKDISAKRKTKSNPGRSVQNVKNRSASAAKKPALRPAHRLVRTTFSTSREMDFFSEKELVTQTGHEVGEWPLVILKELIDNALDACEEADVAPVIDVAADAGGITIRDTGPGLPESTLKAALDFTVRASNREAYVAPDRGAQGNALKTLLPMPRVVDPDHGRLVIQAHGKRHVLTCGADPISQRAVIHDDVTELPTIGTEVRMEWSPRVDDYSTMWPFDHLVVADADNCNGFPSRFHEMVEGFALFNPHATIRLDWFGTKTAWRATNPTWEKWKPCKPTSPHWYEQAHIARLIGAYITHDRDNGKDRLVSEFVAEFDGLTGSQKRTKVLDDADLRRVKLSEFVVNDHLDNKRIAKLLSAMQKHTRPVNPRRLGIIGEDHLRARLLEMGVQEDSFNYTKRLGKGDVPWVLESAFGWLGDAAEDNRRIYTGANWSAAIKNPYRSFGSTGVGLEATLSELYAGAHEPIVFVLHLTHPRVEYTDRGKSALIVKGGGQ